MLRPTSLRGNFVVHVTVLILLTLAIWFQSNHQIVTSWNSNFSQMVNILVPTSVDHHTNQTTAAPFMMTNDTSHKEEESISSATQTQTLPPLPSSPPILPILPVLRDIHMVFIGDSVMRYQYLSMAYRLKYGVWFDDSMWYYHLVNERSFADPYHNHTWGAFLYHTHQILQPQEATCDCHRKPVNWMQDIVENRYYYDAKLNNSLVYLLAYGHSFAMEGRLQPQHVWNQTKEWQTNAFAQFKGGSTWRYRDWSDTIRHHIRYLDPQPRHIVMNAGLWPCKFGWAEAPNVNNTNNGTLTPYTHTMLQVMKETTPEYNYVWRTTTYSRDRRANGVEGDAFMCEQSAITCVNVSFSRHVRQDLYWDNAHFLEPFYRAVNEQLLEQLDYLPDGYTRMNMSDILEQQ